MTLDEETIKQIIEGHKKYNGNSTETAKQVYVSTTAVQKYWKINGLYIKPKRKELPEQEIREIISAHKKYKGVGRIASRELGYPIKRILKYWKHAELPIRGVGGNVRGLEEKLKITPSKPRTASS